MKKKINILIITSIAAVIALSGIQAYLIHNTYQLKKDAFIKETKRAISDIDNTAKMDSLAELWYTKLTASLTEYKRNKMIRTEVIERFKPASDSLNHLFKAYYEEEVAKRDLGYDLKYKKTIKSVVIHEKDVLDTIFSAAKGENYFLFGHKFKHEDGNLMSKARWFTEHDAEDNKEKELLPVSFDLEIRTEDYINIIGWKRIVFGQMAILFLFSGLLFLFVVGLLFYSIRNLIMQKKLAEIKTDFINNITHELKTPLATLSIASKSLRNKEIKASSEAFENTLNILDRQNNRLQKLIDQVMTNSLGSEQIVLNKESILDDVYIKNVIADFKLSVQNKNVSVISKIEFEKINLTIDKFMLNTALFNVLENAVKYGKEAVEIAVRTKRVADSYVIEIHDNGIGVPEKEQPKIFEKFYRVTSGDVHNVKGLGLGLYYTNQIIKAHQGTIKLESKPSLGTTFTITIPIIIE